MKEYGAIVIKQNIAMTKRLLEEYRDSLTQMGNMFVFVRNEYDEIGDVTNDVFDVIAHAVSKGYMYVNTIVVPTTDFIHVNLPDNVVYVVWLAKDKNHYFEKDAIREEHIWEKVEWGHRAKNYNPKGKDPGNVWIPTKDDGKAHITEHILLDTAAVFDRIYKSCHMHNLPTLLVSDEAINVNKYSDLEFVFTACPSQQPVYNIVNLDPVGGVQKTISAEVVWGTSESMTNINNGSVDVVVTSPPYWDLKDYFKEGQIGQESYETYLGRLDKVWKECYDKLSDNGSFWLNINVRVKNNSVILIPRDFVAQCKKIGFHYKGIAIWHKSSGIPTHDKNIVDRYEFVLVFSKSSALTIKKDIAKIADYKNRKINGGLFWNINRKAGSVGKKFIHPAIYPNELVGRILDITTNKYQTVLDPFLGSGTTVISAIERERHSIGFEYNEGFKPLILSRIQNEVGKRVFNLTI